MTRHDEPAEGDVAGVTEVLAAHVAHWSPTVSPRAECSCGEWQKALLTDDAIEDAHRAHVADALRDLIAAAEQRGRVAALREVADDRSCGGCRGLGNHQRYCPRHPEYHPWRVLAARAEGIGDIIGGNSPGVANLAYALSGAIKELIVQHPYRATERAQ